MQSETITNLGEVKPVIVIGGKTGKFVPNMNMSFHDDEFFINLNRKDKIITDEIAEINDYKTILSGIDKDVFHVNENGEFKWDIVFKEKPEKNIFKWKIKYKGVRFFYQGELTPEEIADKCERSEEAIGSYAVYCNKSNNKYKTGKVCHIYRPLCIDSSGKQVYADLMIDDKYLTITIPQDYIDNASYPMTLDPTIGYTTAGSSTYTWSVDSSLSFKDIIGYTASSSGDVTDININVGNVARSGEVGYYQGTTRISTYLKTSGWTTGWNSISLSGSIVSGNAYSPAIGIAPGTDNNKQFQFKFDTYTAGSQYSFTYPLASTWGSGTNQNQRISMYMNYTESGGTSEGSLVGQSPLVGGGVLCGQGNLIN